MVGSAPQDLSPAAARRDAAAVQTTDPRRRGAMVVLGAGVVSALAVLASTWRGIGVIPTDSLAYLTMADEIASGRAPYPVLAGVESVHYPPGWSLLVGTITAVAPWDAMAVGRVVNAALVLLLPLLVYGALWSRARNAPWIPVLVGVYVAASYPLFELGSRAVSEPLFLCLLVASLMAIERFTRDGSDARLATASALVGGLLLTRFVGVAAIVPLGLAVLATTPGWRRRASRLGLVLLLAVVPTAAWYVLAPGSLGSVHLTAREPAGIDLVLVTIKNAGATLGRGVFLPTPVRYGLGLVLVAAPFVVVAVSSKRATTPEPRWRGVARACTRLGVAPWLWFLLVYTLLVTVQRWGGNAPILARYWLPYWVVTAVIVGRCLLEWAARTAPTWRAAVVAVCAALVGLATYNAGQVATTARSNARDGITLNAVRYQKSTLFASIADGGPDVVYADDHRLAAFQGYVHGHLVPVERISCRVGTVDSLVDEVHAEQARGSGPAIVLLGRCREDAFVDALLERLPGARVEEEADVGVLVWPA